MKPSSKKVQKNRLPCYGIGALFENDSDDLHLSDLKGKVGMVEFWTFGCYNCRNVEPYVKQWHQKYADKGLVIIGVHSPEFSYEHDFAKVKECIRDHDIRFPIPIDNDFSTMYLIDK